MFVSNSFNDTFEWIESKSGKKIWTDNPGEQGIYVMLLFLVFLQPTIISVLSSNNLIKINKIKRDIAEYNALKKECTKLNKKLNNLKVYTNRWWSNKQYTQYKIRKE